MTTVPGLRDYLRAPGRALAAVMEGVLPAGAGRMDSAPPIVVHPTEPTPRMDSARADAGCGGSGSSCDLSGELNCGVNPYRDFLQRPVLSRSPIDQLFLRSLLMQRIVQLLPADMLRRAPDLESSVPTTPRPVADGRTLPRFRSDAVDAEALWDDAAEKLLPLALFDAMTYARKDGGGGVLCFIEDGLDPSEPVRLDQITRVRGFHALSRWELIAVQWDGSTAPAWYGERFNRPSHYVAAPASGAANYVSGVWHRSRILPFAHVRLERRLAEYYAYNGWGPGVIEGIFTEFTARDGGARRLGDIIRSFGYDHLELPNLEDMLSTENGPARLKQLLDNMRTCLQHTGDGVPVVATGSDQKLNPLHRTVTGVDKLTNAQREYLLDVLEYPAVVLWGRTNQGLGSGSGEAAGEWQSYYTTVENKNTTWLWPPLRQGLILLQAAKLGRTRGQIDMRIRADWKSLWVTPEKDRAEARKKNAEARFFDLVQSGVVSPQEVRQNDPTLREDYPETDFESQWETSTQAPERRSPLFGSTAETTALIASGRPEVATADDEPAPEDLEHEMALRRLYKLSRKEIRGLGVTPYGAGRRLRYSRSAVLRAMRRDANNLLQRRTTDDH